MTRRGEELGDSEDKVKVHAGYNKTQQLSMEVNSIDEEAAYLTWLNLLDLSRDKLTTLEQLKSGVILMKLLHQAYLSSIQRSRDPEAFPTTGFKTDPEEHWASCAANLQLLNKHIDAYLVNVVKVSIEPGYINVQAIARNSDRYQILRLVNLHPESDLV
jgi:hypothetical protein